LHVFILSLSRYKTASLKRKERDLESTIPALSWSLSWPFSVLLFLSVRLVFLSCIQYLVSLLFTPNNPTLAAFPLSPLALFQLLATQRELFLPVDFLVELFVRQLNN
ncbi:hypothetical protein F2P56_029775, partial [Juglans regia]